MSQELEAVNWEHRITLLEAAVTNGQAAVASSLDNFQKEMRALRIDLVARVERSEARLDKLEEWRAMRQKEIAFEAGAREGRTGLRKSEMAFLATSATAMGVLVGLIPHLIGFIR